MKPHRGSLILVLGILSLIMCQPLGIAAWIMGNGDLREMDAGMMDPEGRQLTVAGRICGMIASILLIVGLVITIGFFILMALGAIASQA